MILKSIASAFKRIGLGLAVAGATVFAVGGCEVLPNLPNLQSLIQSVLPVS